MVAQAKKMVTTTTSHIPKKRLIELLDMEHGDGVDGYNINEVKDRVINKLDRTLPQVESQQKESRQVGRLSRRDLDYADRASVETNGSSGSSLGSFKMSTMDSSSSNSGTLVYEASCSSTDEYATSDNVTDSATTESPIDMCDALSNPTSTFDDTQSDNLENHNLSEENSDLQVEDREALQTLESLTQESTSFSDNEKKLLEQMKKMQDDHTCTIRGYEDHIDELRKKVEGLQNLADKLKTETETQRDPGEAPAKQGNHLCFLYSFSSFL